MLPSVRTTNAASSLPVGAVHALSTQPFSAGQRSTAPKPRTVARPLAVRSEGSKHPHFVPVLDRSATGTATSDDVLQSINQLRDALRKRVTPPLPPSSSLPVTSAELSAAKGMLSDMGQRGLSAEELCALTGVTPASPPVSANASTSTRFKSPSPPPATAASRPRQFDTVHALVAADRPAFGDEGMAPASQAFIATMTNVETAMNSPVVARQRVTQTTTRLLTLVDAWEELCNGDYDGMADAVTSRMVVKAPPLTDTPISGTSHSDALAFMGMVGRAVHVFTSPEDIVEMTLEVGAKHSAYNVTEAHYLALRDAFMEELPYRLPSETYAATLALWNTMWRITISLFVTSVNTDRGACYTKRKHDRWVDIVQKTIKRVVECEKGGPQDERKHPFMMHMYDRGVAVDPSMKRFFMLREVRNSDRSMEAVIRIVTNLHDMSSVDPFVEELGFLHIEYGMTEKTLTTYRQPFLDTCAQYIGTEAEYWNPDAINAVGKLWDYLAHKWAVGFTVNKRSMTSANAPDTAGDFCLVFTDIEGSTKLWEKDRDVMGQAVRNHHRIVRALIADFEGYEVKTVGDSFMVACKDALIALKIAVGIQLEFMRTPTAQGFEMIDNPQGTGDPNCWRSDAVRVRVGIHYCTHANAVYDSVQRRYDYYGTDVNLAARTEAAACGGQILMTAQAHGALQKISRFHTEPRHRLLAGISTVLEKGSAEYMKPLSAYVKFEDLGWRSMKGIAEPVQLFSAVPVDLAGRVFADKTSGSVTSDASSTTFHGLGLGAVGVEDDGMEDVVLVKPLGLSSTGANRELVDPPLSIGPSGM